MFKFKENINELKIGESSQYTKGLPFGDVAIVLTRTREDLCEIDYVQDDIILQKSIYDFPNLKNGEITSKTNMMKDLTFDQICEFFDFEEIVRVYTHLMSHHQSKEKSKMVANLHIGYQNLSGTVFAKMDKEGIMDIEGTDDCIFVKGKITGWDIDYQILNRLLKPKPSILEQLLMGF